MTELEQKKEYLKSYKKQCQKIKSLEEQLESLRISIESAKGQVITDMPRSSNQKDLSDGIVKLDSVMFKLIKAIKSKAVIRSEIESRIADMEDGIESCILHKKYIEFKEWEQICVEIGYSWRQTHRYHSKALHHFNIN